MRHLHSRQTEHHKKHHFFVLSNDNISLIFFVSKKHTCGSCDIPPNGRSSVGAPLPRPRARPRPRSSPILKNHWNVLYFVQFFGEINYDVGFIEIRKFDHENTIKVEKHCFLPKFSSKKWIEVVVYAREKHIRSWTTCSTKHDCGLFAAAIFLSEYVTSTHCWKL